MTDALHARIDALIRPQQVHRDVYTSPEVYQLEMKHLFPNAWVYIGHDSQTPNKGDYITAQIGDQPLLMVRHTDNEIHVLYNRCPHKGTKIVIDRAGNTGKFFRCPYHAWSFKTDGCVLAIPLKKGYEGTGLEDTEAAHGMAAVGATQNYRGFVFARLAPEGISFEDFFGDLNSRQREQVWGATLGTADRVDELTVEREMKVLQEALEKRMTERIADDLSLPQRAAVFRFPSQLDALTPPLKVLVEAIFGESRYEESPWLRGIYFTSATQEGSPIDRMVAGIAGALGLSMLCGVAAAEGET